jgi:probable HAF family extracellular repeat protein
VKTTRTLGSWLLLLVAAAFLSISIVLLIRFYNSPPHYKATVLSDFDSFRDKVYSHSNGINASGQVAGWCYERWGKRAVRWTDTTPEGLGKLFGEADELSDSFGVVIEDSGDVKGLTKRFVGGARYDHYLVKWTGKIPAAIDNLEFTSNASGQKVGHEGVGVGVRRTRTTTEYLDGLGGKSINGYGINASGQIAGDASLRGDRITHAVRWSGTTAEDLGTLGGDHSYGYAINISGDVVGMSETKARDERQNAVQVAFLYMNGKMYDLEALLLPGSGVTELIIGQDVKYNNYPAGNSINDRGQIAASGLVHGGRHALRLDPIGMSRSTRLLFLIGGIALSVVIFLFLLTRRSGGLQKTSAAFRNKSSSRAT